MTTILVTEPGAVNQLLEGLPNDAPGVEPLRRRVDKWSDPSVGGHVQAPGDGPKGRDAFTKGIRPGMVLVAGGSFAGSGQREGEVTLRLAGIGYEGDVDLLHGLQHGRAGQRRNAI